MSPRFKILYLFHSPHGVLAEVKRLDQPSDAPKGQVYQWLWISEDEVTTLRFSSMATEPRQEREFEEARLWFDDKRGELVWRGGPGIRLALAPGGSLSPRQHQTVQRHLQAGGPEMSPA